MKLNITRGGSGKWAAFVGKQAILAGHVPSRIKGDGFLKICKRQIIRGLQGNTKDETNAIRGGQIHHLELDGFDVQIEKLRIRCAAEHRFFCEVV